MPHAVFVTLIHRRRCSHNWFRYGDGRHLSRLGWLLITVHRVFVAGVIASLLHALLFKERLNVVSVVNPVEEVELGAVHCAQQSPNLGCTCMRRQLPFCCAAACIVGVKIIVRNGPLEILRCRDSIPVRG